MRVKVIKQFRDKETFDLHKLGTEIELTDQRVEEINSTHYGLFVEIMDPEYKNMTKKELVEIAEDKGVDINQKMTKAEIIEELMK